MKKSECIGALYKASIYCGNIKGGLGLYVRLKQSRLMCKGCAKCEWVDEHFRCTEDTIIDIEKAKNNHYYLITPINESVDFETGIVDDYDLIMEEYPMDKI